MNHISNVIKAVIENISAGQSYEQKILKTWESILKKEEFRHSIIEKVHNGHLEILIDSSAWLYQFRIKKKHILQKLQKQIPAITDIHFKLGIKR